MIYKLNIVDALECAEEEFPKLVSFDLADHEDCDLQDFGQMIT